MKFTVAKKLALGFGTVLLLLLFMGGYSYSELKSTETTYENLLDDRVQKMNMIRELTALSKEMQLANRGFLLIGNDDNLADYEEAKVKYAQLSKALESKLTKETDKELLQELEQYSSQYIQVAEETISLKKRSDTRYVDVISKKGPPLVIGFREKADEMMKYQTEALTQEREETHKKVKKLEMSLMIFSIVALAIGAVAAAYISRIISKPILALSAVAEKVASGDLTQEAVQVKTKDEIADLAYAFNEMVRNLRELIQQIQSSAELVTTSSEELLATSEQATLATNQISSAIQEVAGGAETQVAGSQESSRAMEEVSMGIQRIAESSSMVSDSAQEAMTLSTEGNDSIHRAIQQMDTIGLVAQHTARDIQLLTERSKEISKITEVITGIAEQTNLLALNAAIEAARAGEHGRGFAVVADEVRKLAEESRVSANQIIELIKEIQTDTDNANINMGNSSKEVLLGKEIIQQTGEAFGKILKSVSLVNEQIQEVSATAEQISANSEQVSASVEQLAQIAMEASEGSQSVAASSEEQLASMEEITASADSLSQLAQDLQGMVAKFRV